MKNSHFMAKKIKLLLAFIIFNNMLQASQKNNYIGVGLNKPFRTGLNPYYFGISYFKDSFFNRKITVKGGVNFIITQYEKTNTKLYNGFEVALLYKIKLIKRKDKSNLYFGPSFLNKSIRQNSKSTTDYQWKHKFDFNGAGMKIMFNQKIYKSFYLNTDFDIYYGISKQIWISNSNEFNFEEINKTFAFNKLISLYLTYKF